MAPLTRRNVRWVFGATFLWIALLQYVWLGVERAEPYPALILPGFPAHCAGCLLETGQPSTKEPELTVQFADGRAQRVPMDIVLPAGPSVRLIAFATAFTDGSFASNPDARAWLRSRIDQRFPGRSVSGLDIDWRTATYPAADASSVEYGPPRTIHVDLGSGQ